MKSIGVIGASSLVGQCILAKLSETDTPVYAFSRAQPRLSYKNITWLQINPLDTPANPTRITHWICVMSIWQLADYFPLLERYGADRIIALSSTSALSKQDSSEAQEVKLAQQLQSGEQALQQWASTHNVAWIILRPTLIYGFGKDKNISEITNFIRRFGFFPLLGTANGLRMPVHANDVANACIDSLKKHNISKRIYNISGAETLPYQEMVTRLFIAIEKKPKFIKIPLVLFKLALSCLHIIPRYRHWTPAMAERMNKDLVFSHEAATQDFGYQPSTFYLED